MTASKVNIMIGLISSIIITITNREHIFKYRLNTDYTNTNIYKIYTNAYIHCCFTLLYYILYTIFYTNYNTLFSEFNVIQGLLNAKLCQGLLMRV